MNDRRLKIGLVSMNVVSSWGKDFAKEIKNAMPDDAIILKQQEDFETASIGLLIYHKSFDIVPEGREIPKTILDVKRKETTEAPSIIYPH